MRTIAVANQKGGTGKTTTAWAILAGATARGHRALGIDFDPQANLTYITGADANRPGALHGAEIQHTGAGDVIAASMDIATVSDVDALKAVLSPLGARYDLAVIDCPPTLGRPLICALRAADEVLIPVQADALSIQGLYQMRATIDNTAPALVIAGAFLARHNGRSIIARDLTAVIQEKCALLHIPYIDTPIRDGVAIREAQTMQESLFTYAPKSNQASDYNALLDALNI